MSAALAGPSLRQAFGRLPLRLLHVEQPNGDVVAVVVVRAASASLHGRTTTAAARHILHFQPEHGHSDFELVPSRGLLVAHRTELEKMLSAIQQFACRKRERGRAEGVKVLS